MECSLFIFKRVGPFNTLMCLGGWHQLLLSKGLQRSKGDISKGTQAKTQQNTTQHNTTPTSFMSQWLNEEFLIRKEPVFGPLWSVVRITSASEIR